MISLARKVAIVTGGATGIGAGIGRVLAGHGARLVVAQLEPPSQPDSREILHVQTDVSDRRQVERMVERAVEHFGQIDILVNNAALTGPVAVAPFLDCSEEQMKRIVDVNFKGVFHCSQAVARHMVESGIPGAIVHIGSVGAFAAQEHASVYCATKAAVGSLAQTMALELAGYGIRVNCVAPGDIRTEANANIVSDLKGGGASGKYLRITPAGRRGTPEEVGHAVAWLASEEASFVTGTTLRVDGGFLSY